MIQVYYYQNGSKFTQKMDREQAIKELKEFGYPIKNEAILSDKTIAEMVQDIYTP